jgi:hypothetical protein
MFRATFLRHHLVRIFHDRFKLGRSRGAILLAGGGRLSGRMVFVVAMLQLLGVTAVRADEDAVKDAEKSVRAAERLINRGCLGAGRAAVSTAEAKVAALGEFEKDRVQKELDRAKKALEDWTKQWNAESLQKSTDGCLFGLKESVDQVSQSVNPDYAIGEGPDKRYDEANAHLDQLLADEINKPLVTPDLLSKIATKRDGFKGDYGKARVKRAVSMWGHLQRVGNHYDTKGWEDDKALSMEEIGKWGQKIGCERSQALADEVREWFTNGYVKTALERWDSTGSLKKYGDDLDAQRKKALENVARITKEVLDESEKLSPGDMRSTMCSYFALVLRHYGRQSHKDQAKQDKQPAKQAAKQPTKKKRSSRRGGGDDESDGDATPASDADATPPPPEPYPGGTDQLDRIETLVNKWQDEEGKKQADDVTATRKLMSDAEEQWPVMIKTLKAGRLDATDALNNTATWKGKAVVLPGQELIGGSYEAAEYWSISEVDGIPVCADLDPELGSLLNAYSKRTHVKPGYTIQGRIAVVEGVCKVWQRVKDRYSDKYVRGNQLDAVRVRLVGVKEEYCSAAVGVGTSDLMGGSSAGGSSADGSTAGGSAAGSGGFVHFVHRFVAWAMCVLLGLAGDLALAYGASRFHPPLEEQLKRVGDVPGYAGGVLAGLGIGWFLAAFVLSFVSADVRFGSLPSVALVLAGAAVGVDLLRSKGKLAPEMARKIQPVAIPLGLACFPAAAAHFLFWDKILL